MTRFRLFLFCLAALCGTALAGFAHLRAAQPALPTFAPNNKNIQYEGRVDFSNPLLPRFWAPGVTIKARFQGPTCDLLINDQQLYGKYHNYLEVVVDNGKPSRIQTTGPTNDIPVASGLSNGPHTVVICKDTEASIGYMELAGFQCEKLLPPPRLPARKLEFIGDSITCGFGDDDSSIACGKGQWYDEHNAYLSYGPITARHLNAQEHITAYSGIGLIHSCCGMTFTMPEIWDHTDILEQGSAWNVRRYQPDAVTICLGQNDGIQPEDAFVGEYVKFIAALRKAYPKAKIVCLTSPMADGALNTTLQKYLTEVADLCHKQGDTNVTTFFFSKSFHGGCGGHPDLAGQRQMATELTAYLKPLLKW